MGPKIWALLKGEEDDQFPRVQRVQKSHGSVYMVTARASGGLVGPWNRDFIHTGWGMTGGDLQAQK